MAESHDIADALCAAADDLDTLGNNHPAKDLAPNFTGAHAARAQIREDSRWLRARGRAMRVTLIESGIPHP